VIAVVIVANGVEVAADSTAAVIIVVFLLL
jgi:hypothetical protein